MNDEVELNHDSLLDLISDYDFNNDRISNITYHNQTAVDEIAQELHRVTEQTGSGKPFYEIHKTSEKLIKKFKCTGNIFEVKFKNLSSDFAELQRILYDSVDSILQQLFLNGKKYVRIVLYHPSLTTSIGFPYMKATDLTTELIITRISQVQQSKKELKLDDTLTIHAYVVDIPVGGSDRVEDFVFGKKSMIKIANTDNYCAIRCVVVGMAHCDKKRDIKLSETYKQCINPKKYNKQTDRTMKIVRELNLKNEPCSLIELKAIEDHIKNYQLHVVSADDSYNFVYVGPEKENKIYMLLRNNHFDLITSMPAFYEKRNFCNICYKAYQRYEAHKCNHFCKTCRRKHCFEEKKRKCVKCKAVAVSDACLIHHQENICETQIKCDTCGRFKTKNHSCTGRWCSNCCKTVDMFHQCYILTEEERSKNKKTKEKNFKGYIFFDYECMIVDNGHQPNLIIADKVCSVCLNDWKCGKSPYCISNCGIHSFKTNDDFCMWLLKQHYYICIAHNMKSYDGVFIMNYLANNPLPNDKDPKIVLNGNKIMSIEVDSVKIIDSYNFIPMGIAKFPQTFDIKEMHKGYFPHFFNLPENQGKVFASYPEPHYYGDKFMNSKDRETFLDWHKKQNGKIFDFDHELYKYCLSDVDILKNGCLMYRQIFLEITKKSADDTGIDPFKKCLTLPSLCHLLYRRNFMESKSIALISDQGFNPTQNYSHKQMLWLKYMSIRYKINIQHCFKGKEKKIGPYTVDGYCKETDTVYEFQGCWIHGCSKCFNSSTFNSLRNQTMGYLYKQCQERTVFIKKYVKNYVEIWEHDWDLMLKDDAEFREFVNDLDVREPLKPREALYGGRTNAAKLYHKCEGNEKIKYFDVTSLYPFVQKTAKYPKGVPQIVTEDFDADFNKYFGLVHCRILPPKGLRFPVLPNRVNKKLVFALCAKCAMNHESEKCTHSYKERMIEGTWVTEEVKLALEQGYKIDKIFSIWHWDESEQYDPIHKFGGLFTSYVNTFLKIKQESSGYPEWCKTETDKIKYIDEYFKIEGIQLDKDKIKVNEGLRAISKFLLNSMWGRYCLQTNKTKYKMVNNLEEFYKYLLSDEYTVEDIHFPNEKCAQIFYSERAETHDSGKDCNVVLGCFVTCYGRMKLYEEMYKLDDRVLYYDTDSIIFVSKTGQYEPELGDYLGRFTNEIKPKDGDFIQTFVSAGPKNYAYMTNTGKTMCKIKGFTVNFITSQSLNFESMLQLVLNKNDDTILVEQQFFKRDKTKWSIKTEAISKLYKQVYDKRILLNDLSTLPYGF